MTHPLIQYRSFYAGPKDTGGMTALYDTKEEALAVASRCKSSDENIWANPVYIGPLDALLVAVQKVEYIDWRGVPKMKSVAAGEVFQPGDLMAADHRVTRDAIGSWLVSGTVRSFDVAPLQPAETIAAEAQEVVDRRSKVRY